MRKIKKYQEFTNEEINLDALVDISIGVSVLGIVAGIIKIGISTSYDISKSKAKIEEEALKDSMLKKIIVKINNNQKVINYINLYKSRFSQMTYNEMKKFTEDLKLLLGDVLTSSEWRYCDDVIDKISKPDTKEEDILDDTFNQSEIDLLNSEGFEVSNNRNSNFDTFSNREMNIDIVKTKHNFKVYTDETGRYFKLESKIAFKYFYEENDETNYIKKFLPGLASNKPKESIYFKSVKECLDHIKGVYKKNKSDELYDLIKLHQRPFKKSYRDEIINFLSKIITKEEAIQIINDYNFKYDDSLVSILISLSASGDFINHFRNLGVNRD
jgi:hypothetical protein